MSGNLCRGAWLDGLAPEIGRMIVEHSYGDIFSRAGLDTKTRERIAVAALAGSLYINAALDVGATREGGR